MQRVKQLHIAGDCIGDHGLHQMIAWDNGRVDLGQCALRGSGRLPTGVPIGKIRMGTQIRLAFPRGQGAKTQRVICANIGHHSQQPIDQNARFFAGCQTDLAGKNRSIFSVENIAKALHNFGEVGDADLAIRSEGQQRRGQLSHIPRGQIWLISIGIATLPINRAKGLHRQKLIHKRTGAIINCDPPHMAVVCVHHPVDKAQPHPLRNKACLCGHGCAQKLLDRLGFLIMPLYGLL